MIVSLVIRCITMWAYRQVTVPTIPTRCDHGSISVILNTSGDASDAGDAGETRSMLWRRATRCNQTISSAPATPVIVSC